MKRPPRHYTLKGLRGAALSIERIIEYKLSMWAWHLAQIVFDIRIHGVHMLIEETLHYAAVGLRHVHDLVDGRRQPMATKIITLEIAHPCIEGWRKRCATAIERRNDGEIEFFTFHDRADAERWDACAFGEIAERYPDVCPRNAEAFIRMGYRARPADTKLETLGLRFCDAVEDQDPERALVELEHIEDRVTELMLAQIHEFITPKPVEE